MMAGYLSDPGKNEEVVGLVWYVTVYIVATR